MSTHATKPSLGIVLTLNDSKGSYTRSFRMDADTLISERLRNLEPGDLTLTSLLSYMIGCGYPRSAREMTRGRWFEPLTEKPLSGSESTSLLDRLSVTSSHYGTS